MQQRRALRLIQDAHAHAHISEREREYCAGVVDLMRWNDLGERENYKEPIRKEGVW